MLQTQSVPELMNDGQEKSVRIAGLLLGGQGGGEAGDICLGVLVSGRGSRVREARVVARAGLGGPGAEGPQRAGSGGGIDGEGVRAAGLVGGVVRGGREGGGLVGDGGP